MQQHIRQESPIGGQNPLGDPISRNLLRIGAGLESHVVKLKNEANQSRWLTWLDGLGTSPFFQSGGCGDANDVQGCLTVTI